MSRKDYRILAESIRSTLANAQAPATHAAVRDLAETLATRLKQDNARFDRTRFMDAAGLES